MSPEESMPGRYELWRQDDNGRRFRVAAYDDREEAERRLEELAAGGHKQIYWIRSR